MIRVLPRLMRTSAFAFLCLCLCVGAAAAATLAGSVVGLSGAVELDRGGQRYSLRIGDAVYTDDTVQVPTGAKLKLRMSDGSILSLAPGSAMRIDAYAVDGSGQRQSAALSLGSGLLRSVTAPVARPAVFEVNTAVGVSGARSTDWFVEAGAGYQQVAVLSGSVGLTSRATGRSVIVPVGSGTRLQAGADPAPPRAVSQAEFAVLIAQTDGAAAPAPAAPPGGGYYPPAAPYPYPPPGYYPPSPTIQIPIPLPGGGGLRGPGEQGGRRGGSEPAPRQR